MGTPITRPPDDVRRQPELRSTLEWSGGEDDATRILVAQRGQTRTKKTHDAEGTTSAQTGEESVTTVQFFTAIDATEWETSSQPKLTVHLVRKNIDADTPDRHDTDPPESAHEVVVVDGAPTPILAEAVATRMRESLWNRPAQDNRWEWTFAVDVAGLGFAFVSGHSISRADVLNGRFNTVDLSAYVQGRERWLTGMRNKGEEH